MSMQSSTTIAATPKVAANPTQVGVTEFSLKFGCGVGVVASITIAV